MANSSLPKWNPATTAEGSRTTTKDKDWLASLIEKWKGDADSLSATIFQGPEAPAERSTLSTPGPTTINVEDVIGDLAIYKRFCLPSFVPDVEITQGLSNLDDVTIYGVPENVQQKLWGLEAQRLVRAVNQGKSPHFRGSAELSKDSNDAYGILDSFASRIQQSLLVVSHDTDWLLGLDMTNYISEPNPKCRRALKSIAMDKNLTTRTNGKHQRSVLHQSEGNNTDFFAFVDYCSAILARYLCSATVGTSVHVNILAHMSRICAKIKVVSADIGRSAGISLEKTKIAPFRPGRSVIARPEITVDYAEREIRVHGGYQVTMALERPPETNLSGRRVDISPYEFKKAKETDTGLLTTLETESMQNNRLRSLYYEKCSNYQRNLIELFERLLSHLQGIKLSQISSPCFEITGMVYETGFERFQTLVFQDEEQNFVGTSDIQIVNYAQSAFHLLDQAVNHLQLAEKNGSTTSLGDKPATGSSRLRTEGSVGTCISWNYTPEIHGIGQRKLPKYTQTPVPLRSMSEIINVLIPLLLANPSFAVPVSKFFGLIAFDKHMRLTSKGANDARDDTFKPRVFGRYTAFFSLSTEDYCHDQQKLRALNEPRSLSNALMRNNYLHRGPGNGPLAFTRINTTLPNMSPSPRSGIRDTEVTSEDQDSQPLLKTITMRHEELDHVRNNMRSWVFKETGVIVKCKSYVALVALCAITLAAGGLTVGVTLGPRIKAVDPFNLTSYCWALAAFVILIAKSMRVKEWSWNDFLHCRVLCRSVSELSSVTGIDEQLILARLVQDDTNSILLTSGPFNQVFEGDKAWDGFSIDRPIGTWAMLFSGIIMIEVESLDGRRLVSLDLRRGTKLAVVRNREEDYYSCLYSKEGQIPDRTARGGLEKEGQQSRTEVQLKRGGIMWTRALGLYSNKEVYFL